jgi:putative membrane protein
MDILLANWRVLILGILPPTLYLWILDAVALRGGTWTIDPLQTTGLMFGVIPIEEMVFFFMTNLIVVFGVILMTSEHSKARANNMIHTIKSRYSQRSISTPDHSKTFSLIHSSAVSSKVLDSETKLQNRKKVLWQLSLLVWIAVLIATPISIWRLGEEVFPILATLGVLAQFTASMAALSMNWSTGRLLTVLFIVILFTWLVEFAGVQFGIPFGSYEYTGLLQPQLADVPLLIPLAWMMMLAPSWAITEVLLRSRIQYLGGEQSSRYRLAFAAVAGLAFTAWDLYLDPMMVGRGLWSWQQSGSYFGIPLSNYLGWWAASAGLTWLVRPTAIRSGQLALIYVLTWLFQAVGLGVFWDQPGPALSGFLGMGAFVALAIYQEGFSWWSSIGAWQGSSAAQSRSR